MSFRGGNNRAILIPFYPDYPVLFLKKKDRFSQECRLQYFFSGSLQAFLLRLAKDELIIVQHQ
jgi:hypothetical protein